jgi:hypothetical protein
MNTALEYCTRVVQEGGRRCKKSTLNDLVHLTPLRIPFMNPPYFFMKDRGYILIQYDFSLTKEREKNVPCHSSARI